jgi:hypothetical protein
MPRLTLVSIASRLNVFTDGPEHVTFCPLTASIFFVVNGELSALNAALVFPEVQAAKITSAHIAETKVILFIAFSSRSRLIRGTLHSVCAMKKGRELRAHLKDHRLMIMTE